MLNTLDELIFEDTKTASWQVTCDRCDFQEKANSKAEAFIISWDHENRAHKDFQIEEEAVGASYIAVSNYLETPLFRLDCDICKATFDHVTDEDDAQDKVEEHNDFEEHFESDEDENEDVTVGAEYSLGCDEDGDIFHILCSICKNNNIYTARKEREADDIIDLHNEHQHSDVIEKGRYSEWVWKKDN